MAGLTLARVSAGDEVPSLGLAAPPRIASLSTGERHRYRLELQAGDYVRIEVDQEGIDVGLSIRDPTASTLAEISHRSGAQRILSVIASTAGPHELEIRALETTPRQGRYVVAVKEKRLSVPGDLPRVRAEQVLIKAERLWSEGERVESADRALELYQEAFRLSGAAHDTAGEMLAGLWLGRAQYAMGAPEAAMAPLRRSLVLSQKLGELHAECATFNALGWAEADLAQPGEAAAHTERALTLARRIGDRQCEAEALNVAAEVQMATGHDTEAPALYDQALSISQQLHDRRGEAQALLNLAYAHADISQVDEARASYEAAISIWRSVGERRGQARVLIGLAQLNGIVGERQRALSYYHQARALVDVLGDRWGQAVVQSGLGATNFRLGDPEAAIPHYRSAVELFRRAKISQAEAANLIPLAACLAAVGRQEEALKEALRAFEISKAVSNVRVEARVLQEIGRLHAIANRLDEAFAIYERVRALAHTVGDVREETEALCGMGELLHRQGLDAEAGKHLEEALRLAEVGKDPLAESNALFGLARIEESRGALEAALAKVQASLALAEELRAAVASLDLRASYVASIRERQELEIDLLTKLHAREPDRGYDALAFDASERARARSLLDALAEARAGIHEGVDPALLARETSLGEQLNARAGRLARMPKVDREGPQGLTLEKEVDDLAAAQKDVRARIRADSPRYAALVEPRPLRLSEIQHTIVDEHSVLLQYFLGDRRSYLWAVTPQAIAGYVLPARAEIERLVRPYREALATTGVRDAERTGVSQPLKAADDAGLAVSRVLLGPVAAHLDATRVVVVADGILESLPFAALADPRHAHAETVTVPLVKEHEVVSLPSASTLSLIRGAWRGGRQWPKEILVLADPVVERDDPRLAQDRAHDTVARAVSSSASAGARPAGTALREGKGEGFDSLPRLIGSRQEALSISALSPGADVALGFQASRTRALEPAVKDHRIVHFATHAIVDNSRPELSSVVLSLFDERGEPRDGFLRLHDVYNMALPVDLVVLSGCSSALGKPVAGEGLISLVRGFMYAGTRRVLASLWKVDDEATAELMTRFYRGMWKDGLTPSASLRAAQLELMAQKRWRRPFYWAAFVLSGDWDSE
jgi:CHAT domain-containing protein